MISGLLMLGLGVAAAGGTIWELWYFGGMALWFGPLGLLIFLVGFGIWPGFVAYLFFSASIQIFRGVDPN